MAIHDDHDTVVRIRPEIDALAEPGRASATRQAMPDVAEDAGAASAAADDVMALPGPGDAYKAYSRPDNKPLLTLFFLCKDSAEEGFAYSDLRRIRWLPADTPGGGPVLVLRFVEAVVRKCGSRAGISIAGPTYIGFHRIAWVRELPPGTMLGDKTAAVITGISDQAGRRLTGVNRSACVGRQLRLHRLLAIAADQASRRASPRRSARIAGQVYLVLLAAFFLRVAASPSPARSW